MSARILVVGAGYAGRLAATRLARHGHDVTLVDRSPDRVQRIALHRHAATGAAVTRPLTDVLAGTYVHVVQGTVEALDDGTVYLDDGRRLHADRVVLAAGSSTAPPPRLHDDDPLPHEIGSLEGATRLHTALASLEAPRIAVVGAGLTGLELASELALRRPDARVHLLTGGALGVGLSDDGVHKLAARLDALGVRVHTHTRVLHAGASALETGDGPLDVDLVAWCGGFRASPLVARCGLPTDALGRALVDPFLRARPGLHVAGDAAVVRGRPWMAMSCALAMPMGAHVADVVHDELSGRDPAPFRFAVALRCVQLGGGYAIAQQTDPEGRPTRAHAGPLAGLVKQALYRYVLDVPALERTTRRAWFTWPQPAEAA